MSFENNLQMFMVNVTVSDVFVTVNVTAVFNIFAEACTDYKYNNLNHPKQFSFKVEYDEYLGWLFPCGTRLKKLSHIELL